MNTICFWQISLVLPLLDCKFKETSVKSLSAPLTTYILNRILQLHMHKGDTDNTTQGVASKARVVLSVWHDIITYLLRHVLVVP